MDQGLHFHVEILAPQGLGGIESFLDQCEINLEPWVSGFNGQVILRLNGDSDEIEFSMDPSTEKTMHASGYVYKPTEEAWRLLQTLSNTLRNAGFPHWIGLDDDSNNLYLCQYFRCFSKSQTIWPDA